MTAAWLGDAATIIVAAAAALAQDLIVVGTNSISGSDATALRC